MHIPKLIIIVSLFIGGFLMFSFSKNISDPTSYILSKMSDCYGQSGAGGCYKDVSADFLAHIPLKTIFEVFQEQEGKKEIFSSCHEAMHYIGRNEYKKEGKVGVALSKCSAVCFEGCFHGVVEGYVIENKLTLDNIAKKIPTICGQESDHSSPAIFSQCVHGIGHGLMLLTYNEVPQSLKLCDVLNSQREQNACYSGIFMENSNSSTNKDHPSKYVDLQNPLYPCNILDNQYKKMCYELQSFKFYEFTGRDWVKTFSMCGKLPNIYQDVCYKTLGSSQVGFTQNLEVMNNNCNLAPNEYKDACIRGVVTAFLARFGGDFSKSLQFCSIVKRNKESCYRQIGMSLREWTKDSKKIEEICAKISESEYENLCKDPKPTATL